MRHHGLSVRLPLQDEQGLVDYIVGLNRSDRALGDNGALIEQHVGILLEDIRRSFSVIITIITCDLLKNFLLT